MAPVEPLRFVITLMDCDRRHLAQWDYDETYPVTPPRFTYPNESSAIPYFIEFIPPYLVKFRHVSISQFSLPTGIDLNDAIAAAVEEFATEARS
jgi:hypothetical protein